MAHRDPTKLIDALVKELKPVPDRSRLGPPILGWSAAFVILVLLCLAVASYLAPERKWTTNLLDPSFFLALVPAVPATVWAVLLSLPGRRTGRWEGLTVFFFGLWGVFLFLDVILRSQLNHMLIWQGRFCILDILVIAFIPLMLLVSVIQRRFVLDRHAAVVALFLSSSLVGAACAGIICNDHSSAHVFQEHFLPVSLLLVFVYLSRWIRVKR